MQTIDIDNIPLHYTVSGSGKPLIMMHGWGCNHSTLASVEAVASQSHTVYNVDFPGFGETPEPDSVWGVEEYTLLIEKMVHKLGIERPSLLGHSFGGRVGCLLYTSPSPRDRG